MDGSKTLIVTGASRGLGAIVAETAAAAGLNVVLMARSADPLAAEADRISAAGGVALAVPGDVTISADCQRVVAAALERFGQIDALVNNAGMLHPLARLEEMDIDAWERLMAVNVTGALRMIQAALPHLRAVKGRVVNISSGASVRPTDGWGAYCTSKAALNMVTALLAEEEPDVVAVAVRPGVLDTGMQTQVRAEGARSMTREHYDHYVRLYEAGDLLPPQRPARAIVALALYAPPSIDGEFVSWDDDVVQGLLRKFHHTQQRR
jgi:NAD(P)-dependent dehydrogenase (short-subunit alcohol dehydrogenase family)